MDKHSIGNKQSLINDQVNAIIEDHDGDLWFATNTESASITARRNNGILFSAPSTPKAIAKSHLHLTMRGGARHHLGRRV